MRSSSVCLAVLVCGVADAFVAPRPAPVAQVVRRSSSEESAREEIALRNEESSDSLPPVSSSYQPVAAPSQLALAGLVAERCLGFAADRLGDANSRRRGARRGRGERVVVLGSGWGAAALVSALGESYGGGVTVVSPRNYFLFTPMLAGASVGTVEYRSICEPLRSINGAVDYLEATATRIDVERKVVVCEAVVCEGSQCSIDEFEVPYDVVVCATGATTNTFGVPGVREHCLFLKQIADADALRQGLGNCFERANLPTLSDAERRRALSFAVVGAGPTGVEFCGELLDFLESEALAFYPKLVGEASVTLLEATTTVLGAFDASLRDVAVGELEKSRNGGGIKGVDIRLGAAVTEVNGTHVLLGGDDPLPYGLCVWATGNGPTRVVTDTLKALGADGAQGDAQAWARGRFGVDAWLRVLGAPPGEVFAIGDCAADVVDFAAETKATLPATAQVAAQQGEYLARLLKLGPDYDLAKPEPSRPRGAADDDRRLDELFCDERAGHLVARPFQFLNLGILAYVGDGKALAQVALGDGDLGVKAAGRAAFGLWRSVYISKQVSPRNRLLVIGDWVRTRVFGRDITRF